MFVWLVHIRISERHVDWLIHIRISERHVCLVGTHQDFGETCLFGWYTSGFRRDMFVRLVHIRISERHVCLVGTHQDFGESCSFGWYSSGFLRDMFVRLVHIRISERDVCLVGTHQDFGETCLFGWYTSGFRRDMLHIRISERHVTHQDFGEPFCFHHQTQEAESLNIVAVGIDGTAVSLRALHPIAGSSIFLSLPHRSRYSQRLSPQSSLGWQTKFQTHARYQIRTALEGRIVRMKLIGESHRASIICDVNVMMGGGGGSGTL
jgi:hypothetical protein